MLLSRYNLKHISPKVAELPDDKLFLLPEKVLQFGTGALLRGLPDHFINKANNEGIFNGRIVIVKSTDQGDSSSFEKQDGLYTLCVRGMKESKTIHENIINASVSRVLSAQQEWDKVLECASNPDMKIVISNTTEVGIQLIHDDIRKHPPVSFPGKLLAFLYKRFHTLGGSPESGLIIIPTELIKDNGKLLESIVLELAHLNALEASFIEWLESANYFCSSLVDRIVPGKPNGEGLKEIEAELGYKDELLIVAEAYTLWAIEGDDSIKAQLSFSSVGAGVIVEKNIDIFRELKLRILNGSHTLSCGPAFLSGFETVTDALEDREFFKFISNIIYTDIIPSIPFEIDDSAADEFAKQVLDRFRNNFIKHKWLSITMQYSSKLKLRVVPMLLKHYSVNENAPAYISFGFAAYIFFMKPVKFSDNHYYGELNGNEYLIADDNAPAFYLRWNSLTADEVVSSVLSDTNYWGHDLETLPGFSNTVKGFLKEIMNKGINSALTSIQARKEMVKDEY